MQRRGVRIVADSSFDDLYRCEVASLVALAATLTGSRDTGHDLAHEALLRAYRAWPSIGSLDRPGAWVRRVVINLSTDVRRRAGREQRALGRLHARDAHGTDEATLTGATGIDDPFWVAVRALPARQRAVIALHYLDDLAVDSIAEILDVTAGTVKATLFAARRSLATVLAATLDEEVDDADHR